MPAKVYGRSTINSINANLRETNSPTRSKHEPTKELSTNQIEKLKLICTTLYNILHLDVATPEVATNLLMHMTFTLGLKIVGANKITYNIPTEAPAVLNLLLGVDNSGLIDGCV